MRNGNGVFVKETTFGLLSRMSTESTTQLRNAALGNVCKLLPKQ